MNRILAMLLTCSLAISLYSQATSPLPGQAVLIRGRIANAREKTVTLRLFESSITGETRDIVSPVDSQGNFSWQFQISRPYEGYFKCAQSNFLFIMPGDDLSVSLDQQSPLATLQFSGTGAAHNEFLTEYYRRYHDRKLGRELINPSVSPEQFRDLILQQRDATLAAFATYAATHPVAKEFQACMTGTIKYNALQSLLMYNGIVGKLNDKPQPGRASLLPLAQPEVFSGITAADFDDDQLLLLSRSYLNAAQFYPFRMATVEKRGFHEFYLKFKEELSGKTRDYVLAEKLLSDFSPDNQEWHMAYSDFRNCCQSPEALKALDEAIALKNRAWTKETLATVLKEPVGEEREITLQQLLQQHRGKLLYIDLWATACPPCIAEFAASDALREKLTDKPVEFIFLALETSKADYAKFLAKRGLPLPNSYRVPEGFRSALCKQFLIASIPQYLLVSPKGELISGDFTHPSDPATSESILKYVGK